ncbi:MAG: hypothetical protein K6F94_00895 [Bacteroidaceae bacterium]|nr:hypothetical protein [Bacteroidaceae bacterium]
MKKVAFMFVAVLAMTFASCGNQTANNAEGCDTLCEDTTAQEEVVDTAAVADTTVVDSAVVAQ